MSLHAQLRPLLAQFVSATGRGNMILANQTVVRIVETLANSIEQRDRIPPPPPVEEPSLEPAVIWDQPPEPPKRAKPTSRRVSKPRRRKPA